MCTERPRVSKLACVLGLLGGAALSLAAAGCAAVSDYTKTDKYRFLSPDKVILPPQRSPINPILSSVSLVDQTQELVPNASFPKEGDWEYTDKDYVIGPTDVVDITILDLLYEGQSYVTREEVSASGYITLPLLPEKIKAEGLTKDELKEAIIRAYSPDILRDPVVSVAVAAARQSTFYILGAVARPAQYYIARKDMRLLEALATAGGEMQMNIPYIYVIRPAPAIRKPVGTGIETTKPGTMPTELPPLPEELPGEAQPSTDKGVTGEKPEPVPLPPSRPAAEEEVPTQPVKRRPEPIDVESALRELGQAMPATAPQGEDEESPSPTVTMPQLTELTSGSAPSTATGAAPGEGKEKPYRWVYRDGRWVRVAQEPVAPAAPAVQPPAPPTPPAVPAAEAEEPAEKPAPARPTAPAAAPPPEREATQPVAPAAPPEEAPPAARPQAPARAEGPPERKPPREVEQEDPFGWKKANKTDMARIIAIDLRKLHDGDPRMNVVIRDNDIIQVPYLPVGEFYVTGEVLRPGVYSFPSRRITVKQALSAAGNVGPLAWPENSLLIRRIGNNQEQIIPLDAEAIFRGEEPDFFLKPDDVIAVGTDPRAMFYAVMRNAFRMTYGFGFIYDRNFSDPRLITPTSTRFTRW